ncbi:MAG: hypothetical protein AAF514_18645 [Verrucomicrobiota bacterium]
MEWAGDEPNATGEWLGTFPVSEKTDRATQLYANFISRDDIESAFHWASRIQDGEKRLSALERYAERWEKEAPGAVSQALAELDLNPSEAGAIDPQKLREWVGAR